MKLDVSFLRVLLVCRVRDLFERKFWMALATCLIFISVSVGQKNSAPINEKISGGGESRERVTPVELKAMVASSSALIDAAPNAYSPEIGLAGSKDSSLQPKFMPDFSSGTVRYEVPIAVPPGVAGRSPRLSLVYESRAGNDIAGVGWKLNISSIERSLVPKLDYASTNFSLVEGHFSSLLIKTSNSPAYESYQPRFQGDFYNLRRFTEPSKNLWQLRQKNGVVETFGATENARILVNGRIFSWLLSSVTDTSGNTILYGYRELDGEKYINLIAYGGPSDSQTVPASCAEAAAFQGCIEFGWSPRNDVDITYERDGITKRAYRLESIKLSSTGIVYDQYVMGYDFGGIANAYSPSSGRSLLTSIKRTGRGTIETAETVASFSYNSTQSQWQRELWASDAKRPRPYMRLHGDFNGDARTDFAFILDDQAFLWRMYLSEGRRWKNGAPESWQPGPGGRYYSTIFTGPDESALYMPIPWAGLTADFSGDGRSDLVYGAPVNNCLPEPPNVPNNQVRVCNPYNWAMFTAGETSGWKLNGFDYWAHGPRMSVHDVLQRNTPWSFYSLTSLCHAGRFYDDARAGLACFDENGRQWQVAIANDLDWNNKDWVTETWSGPAPKPDEQPRRWMERCHFADFDGDHYTDVACQDRDDARTWHVGLLRGRSWAVSNWTIDSSVDMTHACVAGDINADGRTDIACQQTPDNGKWTSLLSTGSGWANANVSDGPAHRNIKFCSSGDVNGDGRADIFCVTDREGVFDLALSLGSRLASRSVWEVGAEPGSTLVEKMCSFGDFSGDGTIDAACVPTDLGKFYVSRAVNPFPDSLVEVTDNLGAKLSLHYTSSANFKNQVLPMPIKVVDSWSIQNSKDVEPIRAEVEYKDGYYDLKEREFLGFGYSKVVQGNKVSESWFGEPGGTPQVRDRNKLRKSRLSTPAERFDTDYEYFSSAGASAPFFDPIKSIKQTHYDCTSVGNCGDGILREHRFFEYDAKGNVTASLDLRSEEPTSLLATADFTPLDESAWLVSFKNSESSFSLKNSPAISEAQIRAAADAKPTTYLTELSATQDSDLLTSSKYAYDASNTCNQSPSAKTATLTEIQRFVSENEWTRSFYGYDKWGNLTCKVDANGMITKMSFDSNGMNLETIVASTGLTTNFTHFNAADVSAGSGMPGQLKSVSIGNQSQTKFEYERYGRLAFLQSSAGRAERYTYADVPADMSSRVKVEDARGSVTETTYNAAGQPVEIRKNAPEGKWIISKITRDKYGYELSETLPAFETDTHKSITYKHDDLGRLRSTTYPSGDKNIICYYGNTVQTLDANGRLKSYDLNNRGSLISLYDFATKQQTCGSPVEARSAGTRLIVSRDAIERPVQMQDAGGVKWKIVYDGESRAVEIYDAGLPPTRFSYDSVGNLKTGVNPDGSIVSFEYNSANQVKTKTQTVEGKTVVTALGYDPNGRLMTLINPGNVTRFDYDASGRLTALARQTKRFWWFKWKPEMSMTYDNLGQPSTVTYPDGRTYGYKFDAGMLTDVTSNNSITPLVRFSDFDSYGRWKTKTLSSGVIENRTFNDRGWLKSSSVALNDKRLSFIEYEYDSVGNPKRVVFNGKEHTAEYDANDRLIRFKDGAGNNLDYSYNSSGSMLSAGEVGSYDYSDSPEDASHAHSPVIVAQSKVNHDASGRVTAIGDRQFKYDANGQVTEIRSRKRKSKIKYDGLGNFARIDNGGIRSNYFFSDFYACLKGKCSTAIMGDSGIVAQTDKKGQPLFFHRDLLGSIIAVTDESGDLVWSGSYLPFGRGENRDEQSPSVFDDFAYGRKFPKEDGVLKFGARVYDTQTNMFLQPDPLSPAQANPDNLNRYAYANNNPLRFVDPDGLQWGTVTYNMPTSTFGGNIGFDVNIFSTPAFNQNLFNQDLQKFYEQLNSLNAERFKDYANNPAQFLSDKRTPGSVFGLPRITGGDYQKGSLRVPPFAALPTAELIDNIRTMKPWGTSPAGTLLFTWKVAPRQAPFSWLGEGVWDYKAGTGNSRNLEKIIAENAGNFNYGAVGAAMGFSLETLLRAAGGVNSMTGVLRSSYREGYSRGDYGRAFLTAPYGDDRIDQYWVIRGYQYYKTNAAEIDWIINSR